MTDNTPHLDEKKSVKLSARFWNFIKDEQERIRRETGRTPPKQEDVVDLILDDALAFRASQGSANSPTINSPFPLLTPAEKPHYNRVTPQEQTFITRLLGILRSKDQSAAVLVDALFRGLEAVIPFGGKHGIADEQRPHGPRGVEGRK